MFMLMLVLVLVLAGDTNSRISCSHCSIDATMLGMAPTRPSARCSLEEEEESQGS